MQAKESIQTIEWTPEFDNSRKDSVWYGGNIVRIETENYIVNIDADGEIRATINGEWYVDKSNGGRFHEYLEEQNIHNDDELSKANIEWENNNWFEFSIFDKKANQYIDICDSVVDELDLNDDFKWVEDMLNQLN